MKWSHNLCGQKKEKDREKEKEKGGEVTVE